MREILFRGKRVDNGKWVNGWYCEACYGAWPLRPSIIPMEEARGGYYRPVEIDTATVGQYTGQTDRNGKRIFEGDIVTAYFDGRESEPFQVCYGQFHDANSVFEDDDFIGWYLASPKFPREFITILSEVKNGMQYKVIGNIHDDKELPEGR